MEKRMRSIHFLNPPYPHPHPPTPKNTPTPTRSEETQHASTSAPRGMVYTCVLSGLTGFVYVLGLLYSTTDIDKVRPGDKQGVGYACFEREGERERCVCVCLATPPPLHTHTTNQQHQVLGMGPDASVATFVLACGPTVGRILAILLVSNVFLAGALLFFFFCSTLLCVFLHSEAREAVGVRRWVYVPINAYIYR